MADLADFQDQRYAPPTAQVADAPGPDTAPRPADRGRRLGAVLLDVAIMYGIMFVALVPVSAIGSKTAVGFTFVVGFLAFLAINAWLLVQRGQTLGKMALGLRIVNRDGTPASAWQLIGKRCIGNALLTAIPFVGGLYALVDACMIFRESRLCLHDDIAGTMVVRA